MSTARTKHHTLIIRAGHDAVLRQAQERRRWLQAQQRDLLNTNYFHVVFTVAHELNPLALTSPRPFLDLLFDASSQALLEVARDPKWLGAEIGFLSILHTWSQNLLGHYHVHCVVPGGGLSPDHQRWISTNHPRFLLPIAVLHDVFRDKFLAGLRLLYRKNQLDCRGAATDFHDPAWFEQLLAKLGKKDWYVYAKPPFGGPDRVLAYLGRYTHRMAISNHRLVSFDGEEVNFRWRDYHHGGIQRVMPSAPSSSCDASSCMSCPGVSCASATTVCYRTVFETVAAPGRALLTAQGREPLPLPSPSDCDLWHCPRCGAPMRVAARFTAAQLYFAGLDSS